MALKITQQEIEAIQKIWGDRLVQVGKEYTAKKDFTSEARKLINDLYGYNEGKVLFKPTRAAEEQFRLTEESAVSYFVGRNDNFPEDQGFALAPWQKVNFQNSGFILEENYAIAMGNYIFTTMDNEEVKVEYTFGYFRSRDGILKINLHHSSIPFKTN
ncbi:MAG TPA: hypothetical protein VKA10_08385 [Prolixibacteraceae bacterium]|nr:hypothetical protein [Prolixibacteraceae bacterium]